MIALLVRLDARRPASWIAVVTALAVASWMLARPTPVVTAVVCGGLLAVAAVGFPTHLAAVPGLAVPRAVARVAWPVIGILAAAVLGGRWTAGAMPTTATILAAALLGVAATLGTVLIVVSRWWPRFVAGGNEDGAFAGWIDAAAMASLLVAMAVCYFLTPLLAGWYAVVAGCWFVGLMVPRATLDGADAAARELLVASAVGAPRLPGTPAHAGRMLATGAAILGWPAIVAGVLWSGPTWTASGPAAALLLLVVLAVSAAALARMQRVPGDTPLALAACTLAASAALLAQAP